tara:strand:- start:1486 stop:1707 length:222 start_codon:yes stop_codon:yes gene_type:complete
MKLICRCGSEIDYNTFIVNETNEACAWKKEHSNCLDLKEIDMKLEKVAAVSKKCISLINQLIAGLEMENKFLD